MTLTPAQAATRFGVSETTIRTAVHKGHLAATKEGKLLKLEMAEVKRWYNERPRIDKGL